MVDDTNIETENIEEKADTVDNTVNDDSKKEDKSSQTASSSEQRTEPNRFHRSGDGNRNYTGQRPQGQGYSGQGQQNRGFNRSGSYQKSNFRHRRKVCAFCVDKSRIIDWKNFDGLRRFIDDNGNIRPRRKTGTCAKHQRRLAIAVKQARHLALLSFTSEHIRLTNKG